MNGTANTARRLVTAPEGTEGATVPMAEVATLTPELQAQVVGVLRSARYTNYSTGSDGFRGVGKVVSESGHRYQVSVQLVRIGSKERKAV